MGKHVFICHSTHDKLIAEEIRKALESKDIRCWMAPQDIPFGAEWAEAIVDAVDNSSGVVLVLSSNSNSSPQVIREIGRAVSKNVPLIPFRIDDTPLSPSMEYFLSTHQWLDALKPPLESHFQKLTDTVQRLLDREAAKEKARQEAEAARARREAEEARKAQEYAIRVKKEAEAVLEEAKREAEAARKAQEDAIRAKEARKAKEAKERARRETEKARKAQEEAARAKKEAEEAAKEKARQEAEAARARREAEEARKAQEYAIRAKKEAEAVHEKEREAAKSAEAVVGKKPALVHVPAGARKKITKSVWLWAGAAILLVGLGIFTIYLLTYEQSQPALQEEEAEVTFQPVEYVNKEYNFVVSYPERWVEDPHKMELSVFRVKDPVGTPTLDVGIYPTSGITNLTVTVQAFAIYLVQHGYTDVKVKSQKGTTLTDGNTPAYEIIVDVTDEDGSPSRLLVLQAEKDQMWICVVAAQSQDLYTAWEPLLRKVVYSLQFVEPTAVPEHETGEVVEEETAGLSFQPTEYVNEQYGFVVSYPQDWVEIPHTDKSNVLAVAEYDNGVPNLFVSVYPVVFSTTLTMVAQDHADWLREYGCTGVKVVSQRETILADGTTPAYEIVLDWKDRDGLVTLRGLFLQARKDDMWVSVTANHLQFNYTNREPLLREIVYSLRFE